MRATEGPALGEISMITDLCASGDGQFTAGIGRVLDDLSQRSRAVVAMADTNKGTLEHLDLRPTALSWGGSLLGVGGLADHTPELTVLSPSGDTVMSTELPGVCQHLAGWSESAERDAVRFAAICETAQSDNFDAAPSLLAQAITHAGQTEMETLAPQVYVDGPQHPRTLNVIDVLTQTSTTVDVGGLEVWEASWLDRDHLLAIVSQTTGESGWYTADLVRITVSTGDVVLLYRPEGERQLSCPLGHQGHALVIEGIASDRGVLAGEVIVVDPTGSTQRLAVPETDVTWISCSGDMLGYFGLSGLRTVLGRINIPAKNGPGPGVTSTRSWGSSETIGAPHGPAGAIDAQGRFHGVLESFSRYPQVVVITDESVHTVVDLRHEGSAAYLSSEPVLREIEWAAPDGLVIQGLLVTPPGPGPFPLLVNVHGGPVSAWRNRWGVANLDRYPYVSFLAAHGYASLYPNPRGSHGRGQQFIDRVRGDMVGADVDDLLSGVDYLAGQGIIDPGKVAVTGNSYGGMMSAWLAVTSTRFVAAIATSPSVDMVSQHYCSDIPEFDRLFVRDDLHAADSEYRQRSAIHHVAGARTPTLVTAGLLDKTTPPEQAIILHQALREQGAPTALVLYPGQGHGIKDFPDSTHFVAHLLCWLDHYTRSEPEGRRP